MALRKIVPVTYTSTLPAEYDVQPTEVIQTWTAKQVASGQQRVLMELMVSGGFTSTMSMQMFQAYLTFVETSFTFIDDDGVEKPILPKAGTSEFTLNKFIEVWTNLLPFSVQEWIMIECVWRINPHWRPEWLTDEFYEAQEVLAEMEQDNPFGEDQKQQD